MLASFTVICFADLKKYKFTYLFGFPALHSEPAWHLASTSHTRSSTAESSSQKDSSTELQNLTGDESTALVDAVQTWRYSIDARQHGFFLAKKVRPFGGQHQAQKSLDQVKESAEETQKEELRPQTPGTPGVKLDFSWKISPLRSYEEGFFNGTERADCFICFADPSNYQNHPGWMLRNLLIMIRKRWKLNEAQILCYRDTQARRHEARSIILSVTSDPADFTGSSDMPRVTGWERNISGKVTSKIANLGEYMDPQRYTL